jgi:hypothetical protein
MHLDGLELRWYQSKLEKAFGQKRLNTMAKTDLGGLSRTAIEARIEYLIGKRVTDLGENRQLAEIRVTGTDEGRALWNQARKLRLAEDPDTGAASTFSHTAAAQIGLEAQLENMIAERMACGDTRDSAENFVIHCSAGLELWERIRGLRLAESRE